MESRKPQLHILQLPNEILDHILQRVDPVDLLESCPLVCKRFHEVSKVSKRNLDILSTVKVSLESRSTFDLLLARPNRKLIIQSLELNFINSLEDTVYIRDLLKQLRGLKSLTLRGAILPDEQADSNGELAWNNIHNGLDNVASSLEELNIMDLKCDVKLRFGEGAGGLCQIRAPWGAYHARKWLQKATELETLRLESVTIEAWNLMTYANRFHVEASSWTGSPFFAKPFDSTTYTPLSHPIIAWDNQSPSGAELFLIGLFLVLLFLLWFLCFGMFMLFLVRVDNTPPVYYLE